MSHRIPVLLILAISLSTPAQEEEKAGRLASRDTDGDGRLSREELGETFWQRAAGHDANGDGVLDATELAALGGKGRRNREGRGDQARPGGANAAFTVHEFQGSNGHTIRYSLFVPANAPAGLPLVLCLHGAGGNTVAANLLAAPASQAKHPCIVLAPACDGKNTRWATHAFRGGTKARSVMPELIEALDAVVAETKADPKRIHLTGQSMGGMGTWGILAKHPGKFAAAVPVCGIGQPEEAAKMNGVAIWAFHGELDETVPVSGSRDMIAALKAAGVKPEPKYTEFPGVGHGSWGPAYEKAELWEWMFAQSR